MARAGPRKVARYGDQFKATAVKLSGLPGVLIQDVVAALDLHPFMLSLWQSATIVHIAEPLVQFRLGRSSNTPETACTVRTGRRFYSATDGALRSDWNARVAATIPAMGRYGVVVHRRTSSQTGSQDVRTAPRTFSGIQRGVLCGVVRRAGSLHF